MKTHVHLVFCAPTKPNARTLAGPLYTALSQLLGLTEPALLTILRYMLLVHEHARLNDEPDP